MEWTNKTPEIPGWYWCVSGSEIGIVDVRFVHERSGRRMEARGLYAGWRYVFSEVEKYPSNWFCPGNTDFVSWCGPISAPALPAIGQENVGLPNPPGRQEREKDGAL